MKTKGPQVGAFRRAVVGLGANLGSKDEIVDRFSRVASELALTERWQVDGTSKLYRSAPVGTTGPDFYNAAVRLQLPVECAATKIIHRVLEIEQAMGRRRDPGQRYAPRTIDLDVLWIEGMAGHWPGPPALTVPHPQLLRRRFAILPCIDLLGDDAVIEHVFEGIAATTMLGAALLSCEDQELECVSFY
jgi:2-amino-4-hydroxy-6-hydroxymethyldihydropteridine diphosphokinase